MSECVPYEPPESLWQLIRSVANERELDVMKRVIGESLVETSLDLHGEIDTLLEIWRDYRHETALSISQMRQSKKDALNLPEPPNQRETLKKEIEFFVRQLRETFKENDDRFATKILSKNHNLNVINYVLNTSQLSASSSQSTLRNGSNGSSSEFLVHRPSSSMSRQGLETPVMRTGRSASSSSTTGRELSRQHRIRYRSESRSGLSSRGLETPMYERGGHRSRAVNFNNGNAFQEELEMVIDEDKLNVRQIDEVVDHLRLVYLSSSFIYCLELISLNKQKL
jgi:hypothetical protein